MYEPLLYLFIYYYYFEFYKQMNQWMCLIRTKSCGYPSINIPTSWKGYLSLSHQKACHLSQGDIKSTSSYFITANANIRGHLRTCNHCKLMYPVVSAQALTTFNGFNTFTNDDYIIIGMDDINGQIWSLRRNEFIFINQKI